MPIPKEAKFRILNGKIAPGERERTHGEAQRCHANQVSIIFLDLLAQPTPCGIKELPPNEMGQGSDADIMKDNKSSLF